MIGIPWKRCYHRSKRKYFLLTNPHNPTGHLFTKEELIKIVEVCQRNHVFIISDDIYRDLLVREGQSYIPITDITDRDVALCCSSTKIFNTPGLIGAYAFIPDLELRDKYLKNLKQKDALSSASILGIESMMAGYMGSKDYVIELREYLRDNYEILAKFLRKEFPEIKFEIPDATYLAWINISELTMTAEELQDRLVNNGKVGIMSGKVYGDSRYIRMNVGCPKTKLVEGLKRMKEALHS
nr:aminotransferase class I/II-fold pyridoxal phosphate-dependent enzyme [Pediococcus pentosaceus]